MLFQFTIKLQLGTVALLEPNIADTGPNWLQWSKFWYNLDPTKFLSPPLPLTRRQMRCSSMILPVLNVHEFSENMQLLWSQIWIGEFKQWKIYLALFEYNTAFLQTSQKHAHLVYECLSIYTFYQNISDTYRYFTLHNYPNYSFS